MNLLSVQPVIVFLLHTCSYFGTTDDEEQLVALGRSLVIRDLAMGHRASCVSSKFPTFLSHHSNTFLWIIRHKVFMTHLYAILYAGSLVSCYVIFYSCYCFRKGCRSGGSLYKPESKTALSHAAWTTCVNRTIGHSWNHGFSDVVCPLWCCPCS